MARSWEPILERAAEIVDSYDTAVTLRQLFYRLVAAEIIRNTRSDYTQLSSRTAAARREGWFPALEDHGREVWRPLSFDGGDEARSWLARRYRRDRTEGQEYNVYLGVEKATLTSQLRSWFGELGVPIVALRGYSSETLEREILEDIDDDGRPAVLLYTGDFDPSGEDILRNLLHQVDGRFEEVVRVALTPEQVEEYGLPPQPGKATDTRAASFTARHGKLVQVELEALDPSTLRELYQDALDGCFDKSIWEDVLELEAAERAELSP